jgi:purine-nucleoside/S-methyl-5'-thioadenosine phosphorylase / adenosine deaminase
VEILTSQLLAAFPHGFTTRRGGVSPAPFDTLNLGGAVGDDPAAVAENWRRLERETGLGFARVKQVHGARVVVAAAAEAPREEADAVVTTRAGVAACVSVADCVPVLLAHPASGAVAAVHAGWRGTISRAAEAGARALAKAAGAQMEDLVAAIGPSIGPCCYQVSPDLAHRFRAEIAPGVVRTASGAPVLDLWGANAAVLRAAGLRPDRIEVLGRCTSCERDVFFSHRRDAGRTGRQMAYIAPPLP